MLSWYCNACQVTWRAYPPKEDEPALTCWCCGGFAGRGMAPGDPGWTSPQVMKFDGKEEGEHGI